MIELIYLEQPNGALADLLIMNSFSFAVPCQLQVVYKCWTAPDCAQDFETNIQHQDSFFSSQCSPFPSLLTTYLINRCMTNETELRG